jgi:uncharacterized repeat protein (TIGR03806 family)
MKFFLSFLIFFNLNVRPDYRMVERKEKLSEYGFFVGKLSDLNPSLSVHFYSLNTPLFSNYAEKIRFVKIPEGSMAKYHPTEVFEFPVGSILIKNFYYPIDFRKPDKGRKLIETRLLINQPDGWEALPYIWNEDQTDAFYDPAGETKTISYINANGKKVTTSYAIPNKNQCKGCHVRNEKLLPIGPSARQLNRTSENGANQLKQWKDLSLLDTAPVDAPRLAVWDDQSSGDLNARARAYLDANCGHCHSRTGPASTSGLFLDVYEKDFSHLGVNKPPVAAGRGAGNNLVDIKPGDPNKSIMLYRMNTTDPAIAMPEIGREQIHKEGVELIAEWIRKNTFAANQ